jgi:hypothetical protein
MLNLNINKLVQKQVNSFLFLKKAQLNFFFIKSENDVVLLLMQHADKFKQFEKKTCNLPLQKETAIMMCTINAAG